MAGVLPAEVRARITVLLQKLNQDKGSKFGVVIVDTTDPEAIEDFAQRVFVSWKLGRKSVDDGVLLVLAVKNSQRHMRIQVGYGLEGVITDAVAETTISLLPMLHI